MYLFFPQVTMQAQLQASFKNRKIYYLILTPCLFYSNMAKYLRQEHPHNTTSMQRDSEFAPPTIILNF